MIIMYSVNSPGEFFISNSTIDFELVHAGCLKPVEDEFYRSFVLEHQDSWTECPAYPGVYGFYPDRIPSPTSSSASSSDGVKKHHRECETKHLTFSMGELIRKATR